MDRPGKGRRSYEPMTDETTAARDGVAMIDIAKTWDGRPCEPHERATVRITRIAGAGDLLVSLSAPFHDDPRPPDPAGRCPGLWEYEVVELFLLGADDRYLEVEIGPHGHHLALELAGARNVVRDEIELAPRIERDTSHWRADVEIVGALLPDDLCRANAFAIHGQGEGRRYLAAHPTGGSAPDFHRLSAFAPLRFSRPAAASAAPHPDD